MSRSPCVANSLKSLLPPSIKDFKSPSQLKSSPAHQYRATLSPYGHNQQCNSPQPPPPFLSPSCFLKTSLSSPNLLSYHQQQNRDRLSPLSVDTPQRRLFISKIKTTLSSSNLLGRGRFGQVVLAKYKENYVAVKIILNASKQQHINEINGQRLSHPNIISILKIDKIEDDVLILMEPWGSFNLQNLLSCTSKLPWTDVLSYAKQLARALEFCHNNGVLHLDVKPANIMVNSQQWIKLGDFGNSISIHQITDSMSQQRVGTVYYCAPEILQGEAPSVKSDVYSYGITLWQLDHNLFPFSGLGWPTVAYLVVAKNERPVVREGLNKEEDQLAALYQKCWRPIAEERPSMSGILNTLNNFD